MIGHQFSLIPFLPLFQEQAAQNIANKSRLTELDNNILTIFSRLLGVIKIKLSCSYNNTLKDFADNLDINCDKFCVSVIMKQFHFQVI